MAEALYLQFKSTEAEQVAPLLATGEIVATKSTDNVSGMVVFLPDGSEQRLVRSSLFSKVELVPDYALALVLGN